MTNHQKSPSKTRKGAPVVAEIRPYLLRSAHLRVLVQAVERAQRHLGDADVLLEAGRHFGEKFATGADLERYLDAGDLHSQFFPWLLWDAELRDTHGEPSGPLGQRMLQSARSGAEKQVLNALLQTPPTAFQVTGTNKLSCVLERLHDGRCFVIDEAVLRAVATKGEIYIARVLDLGDVFLLDAVHACAPMAARRGLIRVARRLEQEARPNRLVPLLLACVRGIDRATGQQMPWHASAGNLRQTHVFALPDVRATQQLLRAAVQAGELTAHSDRHFVFTGAQLGPAGATLRLTQDRLHAATTAAWQVAPLREAVESHFGQLSYLLTLCCDLDALFDPAQRGRWDQEELQCLAQDWVDERLVNFHDTPHDWLGGATPRQAVRTALGRTQVQAWLRAMERVSEVAGPRYRSALQRIWRELASV